MYPDKVEKKNKIERTSSFAFRSRYEAQRQKTLSSFESGNVTGTVVPLHFSFSARFVRPRGNMRGPTEAAARPWRQTRRDVRQMRTRTGTDEKRARRAAEGNLLSYDRAVRSDREVIGKIWFLDYRLGGDRADGWYLLVKYRRDVKSRYYDVCFVLSDSVGHFIGDKTISLWNRKAAISDGITAITAQPR